MTIDTAGNHTISVSQKDQRCVPLEAKYDYTNCKIVVIKLEVPAAAHLDCGCEYIGGSKGFMDRDAYIELKDIEKGSYLVCVEMELHTNENYEQYGKEICCTSYGPGNTNIVRDEKNKFTNT